MPVRSLNRFMDQHSLPTEMRRRLREYFFQTKHLQVTTRNQALLTMMSPMLQGEVSDKSGKSWWQIVVEKGGKRGGGERGKRGERVAHVTNAAHVAKVAHVWRACL